MRLVLDTTTVIAALRSPAGASRLLLDGALNGRYVLLVSVPLFFEYEAVATRPAQLRAARLTLSDAGRLLDALAAVAVPVTVAFTTRPAARDPDDDMVLEAAVNGRADAVATFNVHDLADAAARFGVAVLTPGQALTRLRAGYE